MRAAASEPLGPHRATENIGAPGFSSLFSIGARVTIEVHWFYEAA